MRDVVQVVRGCVVGLVYVLDCRGIVPVRSRLLQVLSEEHVTSVDDEPLLIRRHVMSAV